MILISKFRKITGKEAENLTNKQIEEIRDAQYQFAELAFEVWAKDRKLNTKHTKDFERTQTKRK